MEAEKKESEQQQMRISIVIPGGSGRYDFPETNFWTETHYELPKDFSKHYPQPISFKVPMELGHIISWAEIKECWNTLEKNDCWDALVHWADLIGADPRVIPNHIQMKEGKLWPEDQLDKFNNLVIDCKNRLCYSRWNLVEGPLFREGDPNNQFDKFYKKNDISLALRMDKLERLNKMMIGTKGAVGEHVRKMAKQMNIHLKGEMQQLHEYDIVPFDRTMWKLTGEYEPPGKKPQYKDGKKIELKWYPTWIKNEPDFNIKREKYIRRILEL